MTRAFMAVIALPLTFLVGLKAKDSKDIAQCQGSSCIIDENVKSQIGNDELSLKNDSQHYNKVEVNAPLAKKIYTSEDNSGTKVDLFINNAHLKGDSATAVEINTQVSTFINNGIIGDKSNGNSVNSLAIQKGSVVDSLYNYGTIYRLSITNGNGNSSSLTTLYNYGLLSFEASSGFFSSAVNVNNATLTLLINTGTIFGGVSYNNIKSDSYFYSSGNMLLPNAGINGDYTHLKSKNNNNSKSIYITNYSLGIQQNASDFNAFSSVSSSDDASNSHIIISDEGSGTFKLANGKPIAIRVNDKTELDKEYKLNKIFLSNSNGTISDYDINNATGTSLKDAYALFPYLRIDESSNSPVLNYTIEKGTTDNTFIITMSPNLSNGISNTIIKTQAKSMNKIINKSNALFFSNRATFPTKTLQTSYLPLETIKEHQNFYYKNEGLFLAESSDINRRAIREQRSRAYVKQDSKNLPLDEDTTQKQESKNSHNPPPKRKIYNLTQSHNDTSSHFFFSPFVSYDMFYNNGLDYKGMDYGFVTGMNFSLSNNNTLGFHIGFNYGNLKESLWQYEITDMSLDAGLHYKLDFIYDMYIKLRADVFYFMDSVFYQQSKINKNNLGFALSPYFGKDFYFKNAGILGIEAGLNYQGLSTSNIILETEEYKNTFSHLIYADLNVNYSVLIQNHFLINAMLGAKILANNIKQSLKIKNQTFTYDVGLDRFLGYANVGFGYRFNPQVELSVDYLGMLGDKSISHSGFLNVRVWW